MSENIENNQEINKNAVKIEKNSSKRIYFDEKSLKMIEIMSPVYGIDPNTKENEKIGAIIKISIENLFKSDFLNKIKDF
ncbi:mobilization protein [Campylobacter lari]|nr:mobilization protein [Campylobacter lari]